MAKEEPQIISNLQWSDVLLPLAVTEADLDSIILSSMEKDWRKVAFVVATTVNKFDEREIQLSHEIVGARIKELAMRKQIEGQGNLAVWRHSEVRLPAVSH